LIGILHRIPTIFTSVHFNGTIDNRNVFMFYSLHTGKMHMATGSDMWPNWLPKRTQPPADDSTQTGSTTGGGSDSEPVIVWRAANRMEAQIVQGRLESEGIPAILIGEALGPIYGLTTGGLAATMVLVPAPLAEKAVTILESEADWGEEGEFEADDPASSLRNAPLQDHSLPEDDAGETPAIQ
jgi:hypothetical protein